MRSSTLVKKVTPGNSLPSNNSNEAPPPVLTWDNYSFDPFYNFNKFKVSPPPTILVAPYFVLLMIPLSMANDPAL